LSFFLWGAGPDEALMLAADRGALATPAGLEEQTRRMLAGRGAAGLAAPAGGPARVGAGDALRVTMAAAAGPRQDQARRAALPAVRRHARRRHAARDRALRRERRPRGSRRARSADRRL